MDCFIFNNESINKTNDAVIIEGPDGVLNSSDENNPIITDNTPPMIENNTIFCGLSERFLAIAAGIISIPVINNNPTIFIEIAIIPAIKMFRLTNSLSHEQAAKIIGQHFKEVSDKLINFGILLSHVLVF